MDLPWAELATRDGADLRVVDLGVVDFEVVDLGAAAVRAVGRAVAFAGGFFDAVLIGAALEVAAGVLDLAPAAFVFVGPDGVAWACTSTLKPTAATMTRRSRTCL